MGMASSGPYRFWSPKRNLNELKIRLKMKIQCINVLPGQMLGLALVSHYTTLVGDSDTPWHSGNFEYEIEFWQKGRQARYWVLRKRSGWSGPGPGDRYAVTRTARRRPISAAASTWLGPAAGRNLNVIRLGDSIRVTRAESSSDIRVGTHHQLSFTGNLNTNIIIGLGFQVSHKKKPDESPGHWHHDDPGYQRIIMVSPPGRVNRGIPAWVTVWLGSDSSQYTGWIFPAWVLMLHMCCQISTIPRFTLKLLNHQAAIRIGKMGSHTFTSFTRQLDNFNDMHAFVKPPGPRFRRMGHPWFTKFSRRLPWKDCHSRMKETRKWILKATCNSKF
jgi:hypothetical protein